MSIFRVFTNSVAQIVAKILTILIGIVTIKILTQAFGVESYGLYAKVHNYAAIFAAIADLGLFAITVREISARGSDKAHITTFIAHVTGLRFSLGVTLGILALLLAFVLPGYQDSYTIFAICITQIFVVFGLLYSSYLSFLQAELRTEFSLLSSLSGRLIALGLMIWAAWGLSSVSSDNRLLLVFVAALIGNIVMTLLLGWYTRRFASIRMSFSLTYFRTIIGDNIWYIVAIFFSAIFLRIDIFMLSILEPTEIGDQQVGYYAVSIKLVEVAIYIGVVVLNSFLPLYVRDQLGEGRTARASKHQLLSIAVLVLGGVTFGVLCTLFSSEIIALISDASLVDRSSHVLMIVCWSVVFHYIGLFFSYQLITSGTYRVLFGLNASIFVINIVLNFILITHFSLMGAALASLVSQFIFSLAGAGVFVFVRSDRITQPRQ